MKLGNGNKLEEIFDVHIWFGEKQFLIISNIYRVYLCLVLDVAQVLSLLEAETRVLECNISWRKAHHSGSGTVTSERVLKTN